MTEKRLTLSELKQKVTCLKEYYQLRDDSKIYLTITEDGKESILIDDDNFVEVVKVNWK